jgi:hypothetical protein
MPATTNIKVPLRNVRGSFLHLFEPRQAKPKPGEKPKKAKFEANFLLHKVKNAKEIKLLEETIAKLQTEKKWPSHKTSPKFYKSICLSEATDKMDKDGQPLAGYDANHLVLSVRGIRRPTVYNPKTGEALVAADDSLYYSGAYFHANVELYAYFEPANSEFGKHICGSPVSVVFATHGERFGAGGAPREFGDEFGDVGTSDAGDNDSFV